MSTSGLNNLTSMGVDENDAFFIGANSDGKNPAFVLDSAGRRTLPYQTGFNAILSSNQNLAFYNQTKIIFDKVLGISEAVNPDYNPSTGVFTAPVLGNYMFTASLLIFDGYNHLAGGFSVLIQIGKIAYEFVCKTGTSKGNQYSTCGGMTLGRMNASETANVFIKYLIPDNTDLLKPVVQAERFTAPSFFSGYLLG